MCKCLNVLCIDARYRFIYGEEISGTFALFPEKYFHLFPNEHLFEKELLNIFTFKHLNLNFFVIHSN